MKQSQVFPPIANSRGVQVLLAVLMLVTTHAATASEVSSLDAKVRRTVTTTQVVRIFADPTSSPCISVAFSPDGSSILTGNSGKAQFWDPASGKLMRSIKTDSSKPKSLAFSPDGANLLVGEFYDAKLLNIATGKVFWTFHQNFPLMEEGGAVAYAPDGARVVYVCKGVAWLLDPANGTLQRAIGGDRYDFGATAAAFSPDSRYLLTGYFGGKVKLWDFATTQPLRIFTGHSDVVNAVAFSPDGSRIVTASGSYNGNDYTVRIWDTQTGQLLRTIPASGKAWFTAVTFSPDGRKILTGSSGYQAGANTARLWDASTGQELQVFTGHTKLINSVAFSSDGRQVLTGSDDGTARLWAIDPSLCGAQDWTRYE